ncbi:MAG: N-acetyl-gamma-glutamyl-phosphate reductase [Clostridia bacterium]|jgi:N-acetyl-gamma-glutamyl-phosphate reductase|nr:N-acetyl-gamma-glutamyl-phosphate reductase [Clostridia bacterium]MCI1958488.1 N-acetyl-gamma-glutamyl-phosphate reductase [Clostridia bacterium]MCI1999800.1 N-acetyl-gamma-glutamyl-phosphate reductase [Clostridia bacterium]MCI2014284.1 N-acetyl-gamma-glutamyl-phosphate reductase [Clostridia bacterium]
MIKAGVVGATGYAGNELVRILMQHPEVEITDLTAHSYVGKKFNEVYENYRDINEMVCGDFNMERLAEKCDVVFLALPHGVASKVVTEEILQKTKVIDFGADFRLKDADIYEKWYGVKHFGKDILKDAVYGLCEVNREKIKGKQLIANPGCYTTCSILSLRPLVAEGLIDLDSIIIDAKSGVTGAGRGLNIANMYDECNESVKAYKIASHRHTPEIEEQLGYAAGKKIVLQFTPHLIPMNRGILATCYAKLIKNVSYADVKAVYEKYYKNEYFVRLTKEGVFPETRWVKGSNFIDIGFKIDERTGRIIVIGAIDNLVKGAAGQAVQNMNILFGLDEKTGLELVPVFPV